MLSPKSCKIFLILWTLSISIIGFTQSDFQKDSIQIIKNASELLTGNITTQNQDSLIQFLRK